MESALFLIGSLSLLLWTCLLVLRSRFCRADQVLEPGRSEPAHWPAVAALLTAGDDPEAVVDTLPALLTQAYPGPFHVFLVVAPGDADAVRAAQRAARTAGAPERLSVLRAEATPAGWSHHAWALAQAQEQAAIKLPALRYLWLGEPWIGQGRNSLRELVAQAEGAHCDLVSLLPLSTSETFWERLLAAAFAFFFQAFHPLVRINDPQDSAAAAAPGCVLLSAEALRAAGGFAAVKDALALECALAARIKPAARQNRRRIWLGLGEESTAVRSGNDWRLLKALTLAGAAAPDRPTPRRVAALIGALALACLAPPVVFFWALIAGFFLDIDQFLITFLALLVACGAWAAMAFAAWPTFERYEQEEWHTLFLPLAALAQILLMIALLPRRLGKAQTGRAPRSRTKAAPGRREGAVKVEPRLDVSAPAAAEPPAPPPTTTAGHALRQRIARS